MEYGRKRKLCNLAGDNSILSLPIWPKISNEIRYRALQRLKTRKNPTERIDRWALRLQEFDMDIQYRPGKAHQNADSLSRIPNESGTTGEEEDTEETVIFLTFQEFKTEQLQDEYCGTARRILL